MRVIAEALALNIPFFAALVMDNLFIAFALFAGFKIITGKKAWPHFFFLVIMLYALHDFIGMNQLNFFPKFDLAYFLCFIVGPVWIFTEGTRFEHKRKIIMVCAIIALSWGVTPV